METRSFPLRPIISPCVTYFRRFSRIFPRTICLNRDESRSIFMTIAAARNDEARIPNDELKPPFYSPFVIRISSFPLHVSSRKNARHIVQHVRRAFVVVAEVADEA